MKSILNKAEKKAKKLMKDKIVNYSELKRDIKEKQGVYLIYKGKKVIYIGESKNLKRRMQQHVSGAKDAKASIFRKKLEKKGLKCDPKMKEWIEKNCRFSYVEIEESDLCHLVEKIIISYLRKKQHQLMND